MRRTRLLSLASFVLLALTAFAASPSANAIQNYGGLPLAFEANHGQAGAGVDYLARGAGYTILLRATGADLLLQGEAIHLSLRHANAVPATAVDQLEGRVNYLRGSDPRRWVTGVPTYERVRFAGVYPATDLVYYGNQGKLEYDFVVQPGGAASAIGFDISGVERVEVLRSGDLALHGKGGDVVWHKPVAYQIAGGQRVPVAASYHVAGNSVSFRVGEYDKGRELVIDPALAYSTYLGGTGEDRATSIAVDGSGEAFITGTTRSTDLPVSSSAYDKSCGSDGTCDNVGDGPQSDAFVAKLNAAGTHLVYVTYLGGNAFDQANAIAIDTAGNAYVGGETLSSDFPTTNHIGAGTPSRTYGMAFLAKLNSAGTGLLYSAMFGGANAESGSAVTGVKVDGNGNAFVGGVTDANDFPTTAGSFQPAYGGAPSGTGGDAFVGKLNAAGSAFTWASYLGGSLRDTAEDLAIDGSGNVYVTGWTSSSNFPVTAGAYRTTMPSQPVGLGPTASFVSKVNAGGATLGYSTYLGGTTSWDIAYGIAVNAGNAYVAGVAQSTDFPTTTGAIQRTLKGLADAFVVKLNTTGSGLAYSTLLGGSDGERGGGIAVNSSGIAYVTGVTYSSDFPTNSYGFQQLFGGQEDVFVTQLNADGTGFAFSSYLGGANFEADQEVPSIALLGSNAFIAGATASSDFPTTPNAYQRTIGSSNSISDAFVARIRPLCALNTTNKTVTICAPGAGASVTSPVEVMAGTWDTTKVKQMQVWIDGAKAYQANLAALDVRLPMSTGTHRVAVLAIDTAGAKFEKAINITVQPAGTANCQTSGALRSATICSPSSPTSTPVHFVGALHPGSTPTTRAQVYVDGAKVYDADASTLPRNSIGDIVVDTMLNTPTGTHRFTVLGKDGEGTYATSIFNIQVQ